MRIEKYADTLRVTDLPALDKSQAGELEAKVGAALPGNLRCIEVDLSRTTALDSHGLGALVAICEQAGRHGEITLRVLNPAPAARQLIELTRLHHLFEVVRQPDTGAPPETPPP